LLSPDQVAHAAAVSLLESSMSVNLALRFVAVFAVSFASTTLAQNSKTPSHKTLPKDYSFTFEANQIWTDTGLDLDRGDRVHISGAVMACEGSSPSEKAHLPLPSAPGGALLAKLHAEATPILASPDADLPIVAPSHLYLGVNGWHCHGTISASVHVEWHEPSVHTR
jgi:hypothetical protein